jgi:outer membrane receptor protein involved in Fe transport
MHKKRIRLFNCVLGAALSLVAWQALAADGEGLQRLLIEEILVTAQKKQKAESLQDVPVSISAFSEAQLENAFVVNLTDIGRMVPNVTLDPSGTFAASTAFFIRGMGISSSTPTDPAVGIFQDGMYMGLSIGALTDTFDLESVEVLRGPQGTLFGRNVTGGAVLLRSARPTGEFGFKAQITAGDYGQADASVAVEGALTDTLAAKIAILSKNHDGYFDNLGPSSSEIGSEESLTIRPMLEWRPTDALTVSLITEFGDVEADGVAAKLLDDKIGFFDTPLPTGEFDLAQDYPATADIEWTNVIGDVVWELGSGTLTTILTYRDITARSGSDLDGSADSVFLLSNVSGADQDQQSFEMTYATLIGDSVELTSGLYYFQQDLSYQEGRNNFGTTTLAGAGKGVMDHTTAGFFSQADIALSDTWTLIIGGRYTTEDKDVRVANLGQCDVNANNCNFAFTDKKSWNNFMPKVGVSWKPADQLQFYGSWSQGVRSGGYDLRNSVGDPGPYEEETVDSFEVGMKSDWLDNTMRLNVALFQNEYSDLQRATLNDQAQQHTLNAAEAVIRGAEIELIVVPTSYFSINAGVGYTDAYFKSFDNFDLTGDSVADPVLAKKLDLNHVPKLTAYLNANYDWSLGDAGLISFRAGYSYRDKQAGNDANTFYIDAYGLYDASVTYQSDDGRYKLSLFGKNLSNEFYTTQGIDISVFRVEYVAPPRTYGVKFDYLY